MASDNTAQAEGSVITRGSQYFRDSVSELKKVSFPTRRETLQATMATIFIIFFVSICLFVLDVVFGNVMRAITG